MLKKRITLRKNGLYKERNVYLIGVELTGPSLNNYESPFVLEAHLTIESQNGTKGQTVLKKTTTFSKTIEHRALYNRGDSGYSKLQNIFVYYESLVFDLGTEIIKNIEYYVHCVDVNDHVVFEDTQSPKAIVCSWDNEINFHNLRILYSSYDGNLITDELLNELYNSYNTAKEFLLENSGEDKDINIYICSTYLNIYDILKFVPVGRANAFSLGGTDIVIVFEEEDLRKHALSPHEFCHSIMHDLKHTQLEGAAKAFEEGICEVISKDYLHKLGWMPMRERALIMLEVIQNWNKTSIVDIFKKDFNASAVVPYELYYLLPFIIERILQTENINVLNILERIENRNSLYELLSIYIDNVDNFLMEIVALIDDRIKNMAEQYAELFYQQKFIFLQLNDDISDDEFSKLRRLDIHFYEAMMNGNFDTARQYLSDYQIGHAQYGNI